jgi:hypothetical protein
MALWRLWRSRQNTLGRTGFADVEQSVHHPDSILSDFGGHT